MNRSLQILGLALSIVLSAYAQRVGAVPDSLPLPGKGMSIASIQTPVPGSPEEAQSASPTAERRDHPGSQSDILHQTWLLGEWNGLRGEMNESGADFSVIYKGDNFSNLAGGLSRGRAYMHNFDAVLSVDAETMVGMTGSKFLVHFISNNGGSFNKLVGDAQMVSNIEAPGMTKLYELWLEQAFTFASGSVLTGLYDLNREFYVTRTSGVFLNASHGIGKEIAQTGMNGPSIFPNTSFALRLRLQPLSNWYVQAVALDAVPGAPGNPSAVSFSMSRDDGALMVAEIGYCKDAAESDPSYAKFALGAWWYSSSFDELITGPAGDVIRSRANSGAYLLAEQMILNRGGSASRGLALFARAGFANSRINEFDYHVGVGAVYVGLFDGREADVAGIALAHAHAGTEFRSVMVEEGNMVMAGELTLEFTYRGQLTPWLALQPDVQYIVHPGADAAIGAATVIGARVEVSF
jgi:porin